MRWTQSVEKVVLDAFRKQNNHKAHIGGHLYNTPHTKCRTVYFQFLCKVSLSEQLEACGLFRYTRDTFLPGSLCHTLKLLG